MKVLGLLSFFAEKPEHLTACVDSLVAAGVDGLVAVDGAYKLFPDAQASSGPDSHDALRTAAERGGIAFTLHVPPVPWQNNEVEKRTALFRLGHSLVDPYDDWLFVIDADETIVEAGNYRGMLEQSMFDVASVLHGEPSVRPRSERRFFMAHPRGIRVERVHYYYLNGDDDVLWGPTQVQRTFLPMFRMLHQPLQRSRVRNAARMRYYDDRLIMRAEPELFV